jgi:hypothetical protein
LQSLTLTGPGGIWVMTPDGEHIDWTTLFFTGPTTLHRTRLNIPGIPAPRGQLQA